jgi:L-aminopeptidase/D-esterase-like protein
MAQRSWVVLTTLLGTVCGAVDGTGGPAPFPHVTSDGPALSFDFTSVQVGVAEYEEGPTGATVILFRKPVMAAVDVRGGAPGTVNTDVLRLGLDGPFVDALTLAGGSAYGLSAATGVANALKEKIADPGNWKNIAVVPAAIIFDLGPRRYNAVTPDDRLGRAALDSVRSGWVPLGARGAGRFAMQGNYFGDVQHSGQGAAIRQLGEVKVLVITVVNAFGSIVDRNGRLLRCSHPAAGRCDAVTERIAAHLAGLEASKVVDADAAKPAGLTANTTITVVVTNQTLPPWALQRLAVQVHNSMSRAIQPFGTEFDGDTLFAVSTSEVKDAKVSAADLGTLASETAWDAILASAPVLPASPPRSQITFSSAAIDASAARYEFAPGAVAEIRRTSAGLEVEVTGRGSLYLPADQWVSMVPAAKDEFELGTPRADRLHMDRDAAGRIVGLTINPGPWPIHAHRLAPSAGPGSAAPRSPDFPAPR